MADPRTIGDLAGGSALRGRTVRWSLVIASLSDEGATAAEQHQSTVGARDEAAVQCPYAERG